ncbi:M56 family metallopeptidase [Shewanella sp. KX20019]|uniref:M56 family metallopeptidase n=1 Tax=Shewanella sp. KX20019 TaxID=2803864 RepID=UPI001927C100|nr:M56 family metallopeptidase [Shewanella sp. KX20019]QQX79309.1 M56 family metallopeptidase [Shewanella sp. KX20019]
MMLWLLQQTVLLSFVCGILLVGHSAFQKHLGAHKTYSLWMMLPLVLISSVLANYLPSNFLPVQSNQIAYYSIKAGKAITQSESTWYSQTLIAIWVLGFILMSLTLFLQGTYLKKLLLTAKKVEKLDSYLPTYSHPKVLSPMLVGFFNPRIILPTNFLSLSQLKQHSIIAHEQYHHKRFDLPCNLLAYGILTIFWFNPLFWLAYRRFRDDQELACDAEVTETLNKEEKIIYSKMLLAYSQQANHGLLHTHYGNKHILKERIMQMKTRQKGQSGLAVLGLTITLGLSSLLLNQQVLAGDDKGNDIHPVIRIEPVYPAAAVKANQNGFVVLQFDISPQGEVNNIKVIKSSPTAMFDASATEALKKWRYKESKTGAKGSMVQLDFVIEAPTSDIERIKVTSK